MAIYFVRTYIVFFVFSVLLAASGIVFAQAAPKLTSPAEEERIAAQQHPTILRRYGGQYPDRKLALYVEQLGQHIVQSYGDQRFNFKFFVLDTSKIFAFTQPGGFVYISRGMVALANSEDELAAVLAHEISHVFLRHGAKREKLNKELTVIDIETVDLINKFTLNQEREADEYSIPLLVQAGYDPFSQSNFLSIINRFDKLERSNGIGLAQDGADKTHLPLDERSAITRTLARELVDESVHPRNFPSRLPGPAYVEYGKNTNQPASSTERISFYEAVDGLVYGRRPSEGMIVGDTYIDGRARFVFNLPPGYHFTHVGKKAIPYFGVSIRAQGPDGATMKLDSSFSYRIYNSDLITYLMRNSGIRVKEETAKKLEINGLAGALAEAIVPKSDEAPVIYLAVIQVSSRTLFTFSFVLPPNISPTESDAVWQSPLSFRRLFPQEVNNWEPMKISVIKVETGMTLDSLAEKMPILNEPEKWLRALNNIAPDEEILPGQLIKIVVH